MLSVISSSSRSASTPVRSSSSGSSAASSASRNERADRLTATLRSSPCSDHSLSWRSAVSRTNDVSGPISPVCSAIGTNSDGPISPSSRMLPARERLDGDDAAGPQLRLGLEVHDDLSVGDRRAQRPREAQAARAVAVELRLEQHVAARSLLGGVHRDVGALDQLLDRRAVLGRTGDADAGVDLEREAPDRERLAQLRQQPARRPGSPPRRRSRRAAGRRTRRRRAARPCPALRATSAGARTPPAAGGRRRGGRACR